MEKIDKGIPVPERRKGSGRYGKYPWEECEAGDSFLCHASTLRSARHMCSVRGKRNQGSKKFKAAVHEDHIRIWRIS